MIIQNFFDDSRWQKLYEFSQTKATPFLMVDLETVRQKYMELQAGFPNCLIYYAVKANPAPEILALLGELGSYFDIASPQEFDQVCSHGISPDRISFGNTIKKPKDIAYTYERGLRLYASDCAEDIENIAENAPGAEVFIRILTEGGQTADWPLSKKFGCHTAMAIELCLKAKKLGLGVRGISFHVGSQQNDIGAWDEAVAKTRLIAERLEQHDIPLKSINLGGGMPARYMSKTHEAKEYGQSILHFLEEDFGENIPQLIIEPGRSLVSEAGVIVSEVIMTSRKSKKALQRWVYTDVGKFNGLIETLDEAIKYPIATEKDGPVEEVILAGPTCDSMDILYEDYRYQLPLSLRGGDRIFFFSTGAYTTTYSSVEFNGFPPLKSYCV